jgi:hypothetical protein
VKGDFLLQGKQMKKNNAKQKADDSQQNEVIVTEAQPVATQEAPALTAALATVAENIEPPKKPDDLVISREPGEVLSEAQKAAQALKDVISSKSHKVTFNGEQYLEFEDWQTLAKFYGITVKCVSTNYVEFGLVKGFEARAVAIRVINGMEISAAEAMCLNDERNWSNKPLFQLKSMAQTRACAKALRNVLAWVVVLAGYKPTPAEEMTGMETQQQNGQNQAQSSQQQASPLVTVHRNNSDEDSVVSKFLKINEEYTQIFGPEGYKHYLHNSKGESPSVDRIRTFNTPKQLAWLRTAVGAMEEELKWAKH